MRTFIFISICLFHVFHMVYSGTVAIYVSPTGSDSNSGLDISHPIKTIHKAVAKLEEPGIRGNSVYVELRKGYYDLSSTVVFRHSAPQPVTFKAYAHEEVHLTGGKRIKSSLFKRVTDSAILKRIPSVAHSKVREVHLPDAGITNYGKIGVAGFYTQRTAPLEITINGKPLRLSEWPNRSYINIVSAPKGKMGTDITYNTNRDAHWVGEKEPWLYGYTYWSWADHSAKIAHIDPHHHKISVDKTTHYGFRKGHLTSDRRDGHQAGYSQQGGYFRVFNMLSELDQPGEYFLDRSTGKLYVWPNTASGTLHDNDVVYASLINNCIQFERGVSNYNLEDFTLEACRHNGIYAEQGSKLRFSHLEVRNIGSYAISCHGDCRSVTIQSCEIHDSDGGIRISGGVRKTLTSSGNIVEHNRIYSFGKVTAVGANGIAHSGVNNIIRHNLIHDGTYTCIFWGGNDHIMEYNDVGRCCANSSDCGAIHSGRDWTNRGNIIRYNYIHDNWQHYPGPENRGVMLDDQFSSATIEKNIFARNTVHTNIGGGRDTIIRYNVFYDASFDSVNVDGRGVFGGGSNDADLENKLKAMPYTGSLWSSKYPKLAAMAHISPKQRGEPSGNQILYNLYYLRPHKRTVGYHRPQLAKSQWFNHVDNHGASKSDFYSPEHHNFELRCQARDWANKSHFPSPVSYSKVGPQHAYGPRYRNHGNSPIHKVSNKVTTGACQKHIIG